MIDLDALATDLRDAGFAPKPNADGYRGLTLRDLDPSIDVHHDGCMQFGAFIIRHPDDLTPFADAVQIIRRHTQRSAAMPDNTPQSIANDDVVARPESRFGALMDDLLRNGFRPALINESGFACLSVTVERLTLYVYDDGVVLADAETSRFRPLTWRALDIIRRHIEGATS